ncbi:phage tail protein, partial [Escherichia coli]
QEPNGWKTVTTQFYIQEFSEYIAPLQDAGKSQRRKKDRCWRHGINIGYC